jgi:hypothetical protein
MGDSEIKGYKKLASNANGRRNSPRHSKEKRRFRVGATSRDLAKHAERSGKRIKKAERLILARRCVSRYGFLRARLA